MNKLFLYSMLLLFLGLWPIFITFNGWKTFASDIYLVLALKLENGLKSNIFSILSHSWPLRFFSPNTETEECLKGFIILKWHGGWMEAVECFLG